MTKYVRWADPSINGEHKYIIDQNGADHKSASQLMGYFRS